MRNPLLLAAGAASILLAVPAYSQSADRPFLHPLFTDNMVLQRDQSDAIWGWTTPGSTVTVKLDGKATTAVAGADGKWLAHLPSTKAGGPHTIDVTGPESVTLKNVLFGDVWICSGQSNMQFGVQNLVDGGKDEIAAADHPNIRLFMVPDVTSPTPLDLVKGSWSVCSPETIVKDGWGGFSAVGYFFGRDLERDIHVPIGLLETTWGGTPAEAWTSASALKTMADYANVDDIVKQQAVLAGQSNGDIAAGSDKFLDANDKLSEASPNPSDPSFDDSGWKKMDLPGAWEGSGLPDYDGVVWYRRTFELGPGMAANDISLHLGPIDDRDTTWVNGVLVGHSTSYNWPRSYTIPASALREGKNVIAVRVLDTGGPGGFEGSADQMSLGLSSGASLPLNGSWTYDASSPLSSMPAPPPVSAIGLQNTPTMLYNAMVAPLIPYGIKGAIWYQGEANGDRGQQYRTLLPTMIGDWRQRWGEGDFPFYIVSLANFMPAQPDPVDEGWAHLREAQSMTAHNIKNSGQALAIDIGDAVDIHPKNKQEVARRLELIALNKLYGKKVEYSGPDFASMSADGQSVTVTFTHADGLNAHGDKVEGFAIAGPDKKFYWADAKIVGKTVVLSSPNVPSPVAVRYGWANNPVCNLYNGAGLPAIPFRTDQW